MKSPRQFKIIKIPLDRKREEQIFLKIWLLFGHVKRITSIGESLIQNPSGIAFSPELKKHNFNRFSCIESDIDANKVLEYLSDDTLKSLKVIALKAKEGTSFSENDYLLISRLVSSVVRIEKKQRTRLPKLKVSGMNYRNFAPDSPGRCPNCGKILRKCKCP